MAALKGIALDVQGAKDLALLNTADDSVWIVVSLRWWDVATLAWFFLTPADRRARVTLTLQGAGKVSCWAVRVATRHARVRGFS